MSDTAYIGHNAPPSAIDDARRAFKDISHFLAEIPVIETEETAREAKLVLDRGKATLGELDDARIAESKPLHEAWKACLEKYKGPTEYLTRLVDELKARLSTFLRAEEARRQAEADAKRRTAEEAIRVAREAEEAEQAAKEDASLGEVGVDVGTVIEQADTAFSAAVKADRQANVAERDAHVKLGGGFGRAAALREKETLVVEDGIAALTAIGMTVDIEAAIIKSARAYRKLKGELPAGVIAKVERAL
jgi:hypothetical protein